MPCEVLEKREDGIYRMGVKNKVKIIQNEKRRRAADSIDNTARQANELSFLKYFDDTPQGFDWATTKATGFLLEQAVRRLPETLFLAKVLYFCQNPYIYISMTYVVFDKHYQK